MTVSNVYTQTFSIASGQAQSAAVEIGALVPVGVRMPAAWDSASLSILGSTDNVTFQPLYDLKGTEISYPVVQGRAYVLNPGDLAAFPYIKLRSGKDGAEVNQTAARTLTVTFRDSQD